MSGDASTAAALALAVIWLIGGPETTDDPLRVILFGEDDTFEMSAGPSGRVAAVEVLVTLSQYRFSPGGPDGPPLKLQAGVTYRITFHAADVEHGVSAIPQLGIEGREVAPGDDYVVIVTPSAAGRYAFACTRVCGGGHGNMRGAIEVTAPSPERAPPDRPRETRIVPPRGTG